MIIITNNVITRHMLESSRRYTVSNRQIVYNSGSISCSGSNSTTRRYLSSSSFMESTKDNSISRHRWSAHEDWLLRRGVHHFGTDWKQIVTVYLPHLSATQCGHRWRLSLDPSHKISSFSEEVSQTVSIIPSFHHSLSSFFSE